jgi:hypothetical protein
MKMKIIQSIVDFGSTAIIILVSAWKVIIWWWWWRCRREMYRILHIIIVGPSCCRTAEILSKTVWSDWTLSNNNVWCNKIFPFVAGNSVWILQNANDNDDYGVLYILISQHFYCCKFVWVCVFFILLRHDRRQNNFLNICGAPHINRSFINYANQCAFPFTLNWCA